jgi:DNA-binding beta-propeller fold protein YncE
MRNRHVSARYILGLLVAAIAVTYVVSGGMSSGAMGEAQLVAFEPLAEYEAESCEWQVGTAERPSYMAGATAAALPLSALRLGAQISGGGDARSSVAARRPLWFVQDPYPSFSSIAVDPVRNEIVVTDENRFNIIVYDRLAVTPPSATATTPKRVIGGLHTHTQFASDVHIDGPTGDIYIINNDTVHNTTIYGRNAKGDVPPDREFVTMAGNFGTAVDESRQEMYLTEQRESAITVYKKSSDIHNPAVRLIQGDQTRLADPHGIAFDPKNRVLFVANYGTSHVVRKVPGKPVTILNWPGGAGGSEIVPGSGKFEPPSITVYNADIDGNTAPIRIIQGPRTALNRPTGVAFDVDRGELYITDEVAETISVFSASAQGDVAPIRVLKGPKTMMRFPSDVFLDQVNNEMWVASFGNHLALAYKLGASGDTAPIRIIRGSPLNTPGGMISNPFAVAYDTIREEILVTSCVGHPRIGAFEREADKNALPVRTIQGANSKTNRTMHGIAYDEIHDEIVVPSRAGQAIMTFRGVADGDEAPIRIIQGPKTGLRQFDKVSADPVNNEVFAYFGGTVVFFDRMANGDVAPKRILNPPGISANQARVDPVRNLLVVGGGDKIWIFDRLAEGRDAKPKAIIGGPNSGLRVGQGMALYPPTGMILVNVSGGGDGEGGGPNDAAAATPEQLASDKAHIGVWSVDDRGDVPPRWTIGGPKGMLRQPRGLTVDAKNQTVIVSDKYLNGVLTYSFPELFRVPASPDTARRH